MLDQAMASTLNPDTASILAQFNPTPNVAVTTQPTQPVQQPTQHKGNMFTNALPTIGGILGGIGGTFVSPILGSAAGATLGSGLGKAAENALEGNNVTDDVLKEAALGGAGQLVGGGIGRVAAKGAGLLGKVSGNAADNLLQGQFAKGALNKSTASTLRGMGITDANSLGTISPMVTGQNGAVSNAVRRGLAEADAGVDVNGLEDLARQTMIEQGVSPGASKTVSSNVNTAIRNMLNGEDVTEVPHLKGSGKVTIFNSDAMANALPERVFAQTQKMESLANEAANKAFDKMGNVTNSDEYAKYKTYQAIAGELRSRAFGGNTPIPISDANRAQLVSDLGPLQQANSKTHDALLEQLGSTQNVQDLRPIQAPFVQGNKALQATERATDAGGGSTAHDVVSTVAPLAAGATQGPAGLAIGALPALLKTQTASKIGAGTLGKLSDILTNPTMQKIVKEAGGATGQLGAHATDFAQANGTPINTGANMQPTPGQGVDQGGGLPMNVNQLALQAGLIGLINPYGDTGAYTSLVNQATSPLQKAATAQAALQGLEQTYNQAGGGQGLVGGLLARLGGMITGGPQKTYEQQAAEVAKQLTDLGIPVSSLPTLTSSGAGAQAGFSNVQNIINALGGNPSVLSTVPGY